MYVGTREVGYMLGIVDGTMLGNVDGITDGSLYGCIVGCSLRSSDGEVLGFD